MKAKHAEKLVFIVFLIIGLIFAGIGGIFVVRSVLISRDALKTTATITSIEAYRNSDNDLNHNVYITYNAGGNTYEDVSLGEYSSGMYEGQRIEIMYLPDKPGKPYGKIGLWLFGLIFGGIGLIFAGIGAGSMLVMAKKDKDKELLRSNGKRLIAVVDNFELNTGYSVNGRHPYVIYCAYEDEYNNTVYYFKSENLWYDPSFRFAIGSEIDVYVDPKDYSKNYVDTEKNYGHGSRIVDFT